MKIKYICVSGTNNTLFALGTSKEGEIGIKDIKSFITVNYNGLKKFINNSSNEFYDSLYIYTKAPNIDLPLKNLCELLNYSFDKKSFKLDDFTFYTLTKNINESKKLDEEDSANSQGSSTELGEVPTTAVAILDTRGNFTDLRKIRKKLLNEDSEKSDNQCLECGRALIDNQCIVCDHILDSGTQNTLSMLSEKRKKLLGESYSSGSKLTNSEAYNYKPDSTPNFIPTNAQIEERDLIAKVSNFDKYLVSFYNLKIDSSKLSKEDILNYSNVNTAIDFLLQIFVTANFNIRSFFAYVREQDINSNVLTDNDILNNNLICSYNSFFAFMLFFTDRLLNFEGVFWDSNNNIKTIKDLVDEFKQKFNIDPFDYTYLESLSNMSLKNKTIKQVLDTFDKRARSSFVALNKVKGTYLTQPEYKKLWVNIVNQNPNTFTNLLNLSKRVNFYNVFSAIKLNPNITIGDETKNCLREVSFV